MVELILTFATYNLPAHVGLTCFLASRSYWLDTVKVSDETLNRTDRGTIRKCRTGSGTAQFDVH